MTPETEKNLRDLVNKHYEVMLATSDEFGGVLVTRSPNGKCGLEIELDPETVAFKCEIDPGEARESEALLVQMLKERKIKIFKNYEEFERAHLNS